MKNLSDNEIIDSILLGNSFNFNYIIDRYKHKGYALCLKMLKNEMDASEVLQDAFVKIYYSLKSFRRESKFSTYFYKVVYNTALNRILKNKRMNELSIDDFEKEIPSDHLAGIDNVEAEQVTELLLKLVKKLPPNYATVIDLFYQKEMSCEEIAEVTGLSVSNIKVMLHRGRELLRKIIYSSNMHEELR